MEENEKHIAEMIETLMERAALAQKTAAGFTQEEIDIAVTAAGWQVYEDKNITELAKLAVEETGMGNVEDKIKKHKGKILGVLRDLQGAKSVGLMETDLKKGIRKYAKPVGIVGALTPVTNPTATPGSNGLSIIKGAQRCDIRPSSPFQKCLPTGGGDDAERFEIRRSPGRSDADYSRTFHPGHQ
jgi:acyl-CoA reductase-like NAD-dependent aldehyde dehydrogenase